MPTPTPRAKNPPWRYRFILRIVSPVFLGYTLWKTVKGGGSKYIVERLGLYPARKPQQITTAKQLWVHAASVGEVVTVLPLVKAWLASDDSAQVLFTTGTPTGYDILKKQGIGRITHRYLPIDLPGACRRFFAHSDISQGWIVETEIWPWLYSRSQQAGVKLTIINGRLSDKTSKQSTGLLAKSYRRAICEVRILARTAEDAKRFIALGADSRNVTIAGDLKYVTEDTQIGIETFIKQPFVLAASTHADEELNIAEAWKRVRGDNTLLVFAPRHPERAILVYNELLGRGFDVALRSVEASPSLQREVFIVDTLGELPLLYQQALATFVGGSLIKRGGHNIVEPARFACPTIVGPHTFNFVAMVSRMKDNNAIEIAQTASEVAIFLDNASQGSQAQQAMGRRAYAIAETDRHSMLKNYQTLLS